MPETITVLTTFLFYSICFIIYLIFKLKKCKNDLEEIFYHASLAEGQLSHDNARLGRIRKIAEKHIGDFI